MSRPTCPPAPTIHHTSSLITQPSNLTQQHTPERGEEEHASQTWRPLSVRK
jgi:hypothetical protein